MRNGNEEDETERAWNLELCHADDYLSDLKIVWQLPCREQGNITRSNILKDERSIR